MNERMKLGIAVVFLLGAGGTLYWFYRPAPLPNAGMPAEIIHPVTGARIATTWDKVYAAKPRKDMLETQRWQVRIAGTDLWGYVVDPGEADPAPPATRAR